MMFQQDSTNSETTVKSSKNLPSDKDHCMTLWYYEDGGVSFTLDVYTVTSTFESVPVRRFSSAIENQRRWNLLKADIPFDNGFHNVTKFQVQISFMIYRSKGEFLIFALDDIVVSPGSCQHRHDYVYTFTDGLEDLELEYIQPIQDPIGQVCSPLPSNNRSVAPSVDHTSHTASGQYFLFMNGVTHAPTTYIDTLSLLDLPLDDPTGSSSCIRFAYQILSNVTLKLFVAPINANTFYYYKSAAEILWKPKFDKNSWTIMELNKRVQYEHKVVFYMEKGPDTASYLALDDITVLSHPCQDLINCDFEDGRICSYSPIVPKDPTVALFNFGLFQAPTQDPNWPGPRYDHTTKNYGSGYLYLTAYRSTGLNTSIHSKIISGPRAIDPTQKYCLTVWTRLTTKDVALNVHLVRFGPHWTDNNRSLTLVSMTNLTQPDWTLMAVTLDQDMLLDSYEVQLVLEGTMAPNSSGLIAIDDILMMQGQQCQSDGLLCENGVHLTRDKICNFIAECPSGLDELNCGGCDFESGQCGWMNMTTFDQRWLLTSANESQNAPNAPTLDGSANPRGHYLLVSKPEWGVGSSNAETALNYPSPSMYLKNAFKSCVMQFDYFIFRETNRNSSSLSQIQVRIGRDRVDWATIYTITQSSAGWRKANVLIGHRFGQFMVDIVGHLDSGLNEAMAIDNIQFTNCSMPTALNSSQYCKNEEFMCKNRRFCVSKDDLCDYVNDCGDGSDELDNCTNWALSCNFELSLSACGIKTDDDEMANQNKTNGLLKWVHKNGQHNSNAYEPAIDNTRHDGYGQYFGLEPSEKFDQQKVAIANFYSPMLTSKLDQNCRMRFFYFINGELMGNGSNSKSSIEIYVQYADKLKPEPESITRISIFDLDIQQQRWNKAVTQFRSTKPFQFVFSGQLDSNVSRIAVDDISFDLNCVASSVVGQSATTTMTTTTSIGNTFGKTEPDQHFTYLPTPTTINGQKDKSSNKAKLIAAILIPLFVVFVVAVGSFVGYRRYHQLQQIDNRGIIISMKNIQK